MSIIHLNPWSSIGFVPFYLSYPYWGSVQYCTVKLWYGLGEYVSHGATTWRSPDLSPLDLHDCTNEEVRLAKPQAPQSGRNRLWKPDRRESGVTSLAFDKCFSNVHSLQLNHGCLICYKASHQLPVAGFFLLALLANLPWRGAQRSCDLWLIALWLHMIARQYKAPQSVNQSEAVCTIGYYRYL